MTRKVIDTVSPSNRSLARSWPYPRHDRFVKEMRLAATSWFHSKGFEVNKRYSYILSAWKDWPKNIVLPEVAAYILHAAEAQRLDGLNFPLHKYIHHGLSSQAMLFNLIGPLLVREDLTPLRAVLESKGVRWPGKGARAIFEYEDRSTFNEDSGQPTSIDLAVFDADGRPRIFVESKFVEQEFGGCSVFGAGNCDGRNPATDLELCYLHHIGRKYWSLMRKYEIDQGAIGRDSQCILTNHYQFFREMLFALEHDGIFVLLCDERSPVFHSDGPNGERGLMPFLLGLLPQKLRHKVIKVTVQDVLTEIKLSGNHVMWVDDFEQKYGLAK